MREFAHLRAPLNEIKTNKMQFIYENIFNPYEYYSSFMNVGIDLDTSFSKWGNGENFDLDMALHIDNLDYS